MDNDLIFNLWISPEFRFIGWILSRYPNGLTFGVVAAALLLGWGASACTFDHLFNFHRKKSYFIFKQIPEDTFISNFFIFFSLHIKVPSSNWQKYSLSLTSVELNFQKLGPLLLSIPLRAKVIAEWSDFVEGIISTDSTFSC